MAALRVVLFLCCVVFLCHKTFAIYDPSKDVPKPSYTKGIKVRVQPASNILYHQSYSKVIVHNKPNETYSGNLNDKNKRNVTKLFPIYNGHTYVEKPKIKKEVIELNSQLSHDRVESNLDDVVAKETLNHRVVYKRKIQKNSQIEVFHKCPSARTGQFVYDLSCNQFLNCWKGRGGPENCAPGTLFNPKTLECDFPEKVECITGPRKSTLRTQKSLSLKLEQPACPDGFSGLIPNYTDCTKFIRCNNGQQNSLDCPPGTLFDFTHNICDFPQKSSCFTGQTANELVGKEPGAENQIWNGQASYAEASLSSQQLQTGCDLTTGNCYGQQQVTTGNLYGSGSNCDPQTQNCRGQKPVAFGYGQTVQNSFDCNPRIQNCGPNNIDIDAGNSNRVGTQNYGFSGHTNGHAGPQSCGPHNNNCLGSYGQISPPFQSQVGSNNNDFGGCNPQIQNCGAGNANIGTGSSNGVGTQNYGFSGHTGCDPQNNNCVGSYGQISPPIQTQAGSSNNIAFGGCNPRIQNCGTSYSFQSTPTGQNYPQVSTSGCNPQLQNCNKQEGSGIVIGTTYACDPQTGNCGFVVLNTPPTNTANAGSQITNNQGSTHGIGDQNFAGQTTYTHARGCDSQNKNCGPNQEPDEGPKVSYVPIYPANGQLLPCNPQTQNCGSTDFGRQSPQSSGGSQTNYGHNVGYQPNYNQNTYGTQSGGQQGFGTSHSQTAQSGQQGFGTAYSQTAQSGQQGFGTSYTQTSQGSSGQSNVGSNTNYNKICNIDDRNCQQSQSLTPECPQGFQGITKHPTNCKKFLNCANGITYIQDCAPGTLFNALSGICDFPYNVDCVYTEENTQTVHETATDEYGYESYGGVSITTQRAPSTSIGYGGYSNNGFATVKPVGHHQFYGQYNQLDGDITQGSRNSDSFGASSTTQRTVQITQRPIQQGSAQETINVVASGRQQSSDYVDVFDPNANKNIIASTARSVWPPPFPTTDVNADYIFEYDDGEKVTLLPENVVNLDIYKQKPCGKEDFHCSTAVCVEMIAVCNGAKDCASGIDEEGCNEYLDRFLRYRDSKLEVLEKQRWDNVSLETCAVLCSETKNFSCKSFNYRKKDRSCFLTDQNIGLSGAIRKYYPCDYFELKSSTLDCSNMHQCPNHKCLTSEQVCDGYNDCGDRADEKGCIPSDFGYKIRLSGSENKNEGRIEVSAFGETGYICDDQFNMVAANVACRDLGFELGALEVKANSIFARDVIENMTLYMMDDIDCLGNETTLLDCNFPGWGIHNCRDQEIAGVICKTKQDKCGPNYWQCDSHNECVPYHFLCDAIYDCTDNSDESDAVCEAPVILRLANGSSSNEGRVEVKYHGSWGTICDDDFNEDAAKVICKQLGFKGKAVVKKDAYFGEGYGQIWLDQVYCFGNESSIEECTHWSWGDHNCDHSEDVGVICGNEAVEYERHSKDVRGDLDSKNSGGNMESSGETTMACGFRNDAIFEDNSDVHYRVINSGKANKGDYPWQAALRVKGKDKSAHWCGAVVISSKWILTAAHCLVGYSKGAYIIVAGEYDVDEEEGTEQHSYIEEYYIHKMFRKGGNKMDNDIALVKLKGNGFKLNKHIRPICLPDVTTDYNLELNCTISGFGSVKHGKSAYSHSLMAAWIPIQKRETCRMPHVYGDTITNGMICAGFLDGGVDACDGDSGGPLACLNNGLFTLYGLTSWGHHCGYANKPGVYVKVAYYRDWIDEIIKEHS